MKTQFYTATSLDGFIATEDDSLDWLFPLGDINDTGYPAFIAEVGALAMGSATYEWMLRHSAAVAAQTGSTWPYTQPTWVFSSRSLPPVPGANLHLVQGDVRPAIRPCARPRETRTSGWSVEGIWLGSSAMPGSWMKSLSRLGRSRWEEASPCSLVVSQALRFDLSRSSRLARGSPKCATSSPTVLQPLPREFTASTQHRAFAQWLDRA